MNSTTFLDSKSALSMSSNLTLKHVNSILEEYQLRNLSIALSVISLLGIIFNICIISIAKSEIYYRGPLESKHRKALTYFFIFNLALSDLFSLSISGTTLIIFQYINTLHTDLGCQIFRGLQFAFPTTSNLILLVICSERYSSLAYPFRSNKKKWPRKLVKAVWIFALIWTTIMLYSFEVFTINLSNSRYTLDCAPNLHDDTKKGLYLSGLFFTFVAPIFMITYTTTRSVIIIMYKREKRLTRVSENRIQAAWLAIWLVMIYAITSSPFLIYQAVKFARGKPSHTQTDTILRYSFSILVFFNSVVNPVMYYLNIRSLREKLKRILGLPLGRHNAVEATTCNHVTCEETTTNASVFLHIFQVIDQPSYSSESVSISEMKTDASIENFNNNPGFLQIPLPKVHSFPCTDKGQTDKGQKGKKGLQ